MKFPNIASFLKSATTTINVSSATAPTTWQVLTATSSTTATWQTPTWWAVDSVNWQTWVVVLDADDISDATTTNKFTNQSDINRLANTSWTNSWDQTMSNWTTVVATNWQTVCTTPTYVIWNNKLEVYLNWLLQEITQDYTETSTTSITFVSWLLAWDRVTYKLLS